MTEWLSVKQAAGREGVTEDEIVARIKRGEYHTRLTPGIKREDGGIPPPPDHLVDALEDYGNAVEDRWEESAADPDSIDKRFQFEYYSLRLADIIKEIADRYRLPDSREAIAAAEEIKKQETFADSLLSILRKRQVS